MNGFLPVACIARRRVTSSGWVYGSPLLFASRRTFVYNLFSGKFPEQVFSSERVEVQR